MLGSKTFSCGLLVLATVLATTACDRAQHYTDREHVQRAKELQDQSKLAAAVIELKNALQKNPQEFPGKMAACASPHQPGAGRSG
jgi:hypothetical protein